jgi:hypothetical protein
MIRNIKFNDVKTGEQFVHFGKFFTKLATNLARTTDGLETLFHGDAEVIPLPGNAPAAALDSWVGRSDS